MSIDFVDSGSHEVKNIERPLHIWTWSPDARRPRPRSGRPARRNRRRSKPSIAVLPFDNMSGDPEQGYFADGITEDIITDLSKVSGLFVIARNSSFAYKGQAPDIRKVSRELGVRYVLEGSVRRAAGRVRINAQMIDGTTGGHLWAERYDRDLEDVFAVQDEVTRTIVDALKVKLTAGEEARRENRGKVDPEAYDLLVRARQTVLQLRPEAAVEARRMLERVIEIDPGPGARLCAARDHQLRRIRQSVERRDGREPDAGAGAGAQGDRDGRRPSRKATSRLRLRCPGCAAWTRRKQAAERAVALAPNLADAYTGLGNIRDFQGRHEDAVALYTRAYRLDPQFDMSLHFLGRALLALGRFDEAEIAFKRRLDADAALGHVALLSCLPLWPHRTPRGSAPLLAGDAGGQSELLGRPP